MPLEVSSQFYYSSATLGRRNTPSSSRWNESPSYTHSLHSGSYSVSGLEASGRYAPSPLSSLSMYLPPQSPVSRTKISNQSARSFIHESTRPYLSPAMSKRNALIGTLTRNSRDLQRDHFLSPDTVSLMDNTSSLSRSSSFSSKPHRTYPRSVTTDFSTSLSLVNSSGSYPTRLSSFSSYRNPLQSTYVPVVIERPSITSFRPRPRPERIRPPIRPIRRDRPLIRFSEREDLNPTEVRHLLKAWVKGENLDEEIVPNSVENGNRDSIRSNDSGIGSVRSSRRSNRKSGDLLIAGVEIGESEASLNPENDCTFESYVYPSCPDEGVHLEVDDAIIVATSALDSVKERRKREEPKSENKSSSFDVNSSKGIPFSKRRVRIYAEKPEVAYVKKESSHEGSSTTGNLDVECKIKDSSLEAISEDYLKNVISDFRENYSNESKTEETKNIVTSDEHKNNAKSEVIESCVISDERGQHSTKLDDIESSDTSDERKNSAKSEKTENSASSDEKTNSAKSEKIESTVSSNEKINSAKSEKIESSASFDEKTNSAKSEKTEKSVKSEKSENSVDSELLNQINNQDDSKMLLVCHQEQVPSKCSNVLLSNASKMSEKKLVTKSDKKQVFLKCELDKSKPKIQEHIPNKQKANIKSQTTTKNDKIFTTQASTDNAKTDDKRKSILTSQKLDDVRKENDSKEKLVQVSNVDQVPPKASASKIVDSSNSIQKSNTMPLGITSQALHDSSRHGFEKFFSSDFVINSPEQPNKSCTSNQLKATASPIPDILKSLDSKNTCKKEILNGAEVNSFVIKQPENPSEKKLIHGIQKSTITEFGTPLDSQIPHKLQKSSTTDCKAKMNSSKESGMMKLQKSSTTDCKTKVNSYEESGVMKLQKSSTTDCKAKINSSQESGMVKLQKSSTTDCKTKVNSYEESGMEKLQKSSTTDCKAKMNSSEESGMMNLQKSSTTDCKAKINSSQESGMVKLQKSSTTDCKVKINSSEESGMMNLQKSSTTDCKTKINSSEESGKMKLQKSSTTDCMAKMNSSEESGMEKLQKSSTTDCKAKMNSSEESGKMKLQKSSTTDYIAKMNSSGESGMVKLQQSSTTDCKAKVNSSEESGIKNRIELLKHNKCDKILKSDLLVNDEDRTKSTTREKEKVEPKLVNKVEDKLKKIPLEKEIYQYKSDVKKINNSSSVSENSTKGQRKNKTDNQKLANKNIDVIKLTNSPATIHEEIMSNHEVPSKCIKETLSKTNLEIASKHDNGMITNSEILPSETSKEIEVTYSATSTRTTKNATTNSQMSKNYCQENTEDANLTISSDNRALCTNNHEMTGIEKLATRSRIQKKDDQRGKDEGNDKAESTKNSEKPKATVAKRTHITSALTSNSISLKSDLVIQQDQRQEICKDSSIVNKQEIVKDSSNNIENHRDIKLKNATLESSTKTTYHSNDKNKEKLCSITSVTAADLPQPLRSNIPKVPVPDKLLTSAEHDISPRDVKVLNINLPDHSNEMQQNVIPSANTKAESKDVDTLLNNHKESIDIKPDLKLPVELGTIAKSPNRTNKEKIPNKLPKERVLEATEIVDKQIRSITTTSLNKQEKNITSSGLVSTPEDGVKSLETTNDSNQELIVAVSENQLQTTFVEDTKIAKKKKPKVTGTNEVTPKKKKQVKHMLDIHIPKNSDLPLNGNSENNKELQGNVECSKVEDNGNPAFSKGITRKATAEDEGIQRTPEMSLQDLWFDYNELSTEWSNTPTSNQGECYTKFRIEHFHFLKVLGRGSYGKVMLAELKDRSQYFAIKCLKKDIVQETNDVECTLIEREVLAMGSRHPYLCTLFCTFQNESHLFFVMEYLSGGDLMFHIQQSGKFEQDRARFYSAEIVCALKYLHKHGIIYRDAKLDNICIDSDGHIRLVDFGFCKLRIFKKECLPRNLCGTPDYMAPEIIKGCHYNQSVDWWSFGVLLYEMLIGQSPFNGADEEELFWSVCNEEAFYPRFISREAKRLLSLLLVKDPEIRLGMPGCDAGDICHQAFFNSIDWNKVEKKKMEPPFKPKLKFKTDVSNFDDDFTMEKAELTPIKKQIIDTVDQGLFKGFTYINPDIFV